MIKESKAKNKGGRPSKYDPILCDKADEYLDKCQDKEFIVCTRRGVYSSSFKRIIEVNLPSIKGFARYIGIAESTMYEWRKKYPEFSESLEKILCKQVIRLIDKGLSGDYNATMVKLMLCANHGYGKKKDHQYR